MGRCSVLCAFVLIYVLLFHSMCCLSALCAIVSIYGPLIFSTCLHPVLCAVITFYRPSSRSMDRCSDMARCPVLCSFVFFCVLFFHSMFRLSALCAIVSLYGPLFF